MLFLLACILIVAAVYSLCRIAARPPAREHGSRFLWRAAFLIALVRFAALWLGAAGYQSSGWTQGAGYILLMLTLPEVYLLKEMRAHLLIWEMVGSLLLGTSSFLWAALLVWLADRLTVEKKGSLP